MVCGTHFFFAPGDRLVIPDLQSILGAYIGEIEAYFLQLRKARASLTGGARLFDPLPRVFRRNAGLPNYVPRR